MTKKAKTPRVKKVMPFMDKEAKKKMEAGKHKFKVKPDGK
jgi:hypothetical protein